jgi:hypothetical protein
MAPVKGSKGKGRGPQRNQATRLTTNDGPRYRYNGPGAVANNLRRKQKRVEAKAERLKQFEKELKEQRRCLELMQIDALNRHITTKVALQIVRRDVYSVLNLLLTQIEKTDGSLTFTSIEAIRNISVVKKYGAAALPSRSSLQKAHKFINLAGKALTLKTSISAEGDIVLFDHNSVLEEILRVCDFPGAELDATGSYDVQGLPELLIDGTADGAQLTYTTGMSIQGIKMMNPELVSLLNVRAATSGVHADTGAAATLSVPAGAGSTTEAENAFAAVDTPVHDGSASAGRT